MKTPPPAAWFMHSPARLVVFGALIFAGWRFPGALKSLPYGLAFVACVWAFLALRREVPVVVAALPGLLQRSGRWISRTLHASWNGWSRITVVLGWILIGIVIWHAWPTWHFQATTSLREDETLNIAQYTSQGFGKAVGEYSLARNHIFYNVVNALLPGSGSTWPPRARAVSLLGVACGLGILIFHGFRRGWFLPACFFAGLVALNPFAMRTLLEARGYGLIFFFAAVAAVAFAEWARTRSHHWLTVLAVAAVGGGYTLPYFVVFGGGLLLLAFCARPSVGTFSVGVLAVAALMMLYAPVLADVARIALAYSEDYEGRSTFNYDTIDGLFHTIQFLVPHHVATAAPAAVVGLIAGIVAFTGFARFAPASLRLAVAGISTSLLGIIAFFYLVGSVPIRTGAFLAAPMAFVCTAVLGSVVAAKELTPLRPVLQLAVFAIAAAILANAKPPDDFMPRQNWREIARVLQRAFPEQMPYQSPKSYGKLIAIHLGDGRPWNHDPINPERLASGAMVAIDAEVHDRAEHKRPTWDDLPGEIRFITFPLERNYNRLFFRPPEDRGIVRLEANEENIPITSTGRQVPDPALLQNSHGHGDLLTRSIPPGPTATGTPLKLPTKLTVHLASNTRARSANFLFNRSLDGLAISAEYQTHTGRWKPVPDIIRTGEFLSIPLPRKDSETLRVHIRENGTTGSSPPAILEAWVAR